METNPIKILIADDEPDIIEIISFHLNKAGYEVESAKDGSEAIEKAKQFNPDCIILDIMMPKRNGFEVCEFLRSNKQFDKTLIVLLTALNDEASHIKGLELGGDDFINKPISPKVLVSRISALFRRIQPATSETKTLQIKDLIIDSEQYKTILNGDEASHIKGLELGGDDFINKPISPKVLVSRISALFRRIQPATSETKTLQIKDLIIDSEQYKTILNGVVHVLAKKEFELLYLLAAQPGRVFLRNEILSQVWGNDVIVGDRTIDVHIRKIRVKLGIECITTVKGVGYKFDY